MTSYYGEYYSTTADVAFVRDPEYSLYEITWQTFDAQGGYTFEPMVNTPYCTDTSYYTMPKDFNIQCKLYSSDGDLIAKFKKNECTVDPSLMRNNKIYFLSYRITLPSRQNDMVGEIELLAMQVLPECNINQNKIVKVDKYADFNIEAYVSGPDLELYTYTWLCTSVSDSEDSCPLEAKTSEY